MAYADEGIDARAEVTSSEDKQDTLSFQLKANGAPVSSATDAFVTITRNDGAVVLERTAATVSGTKLIHTDIFEPVQFPLEVGYVATWEWKVSGVDYLDRQLFDVVLNKLPCLIDTSDLEEVYPNILKQLKAVEVTDATRFIKRAWSQLLDRMRAGGTRPSLVLDRARLVNPGLFLALQFACDALSREVGDIWDKRQEKWEDRYENAFSGLGSLAYDRDEDGVDNDREQRVNKKRAFV